MTRFIEQAIQKAKKKRMWRRCVALLSVFTLLFTLNRNMLLADTLERAETCGLRAHTHTADCFDAAGELICGLTAHVHTDACYQTRPAKGASAEGADIALSELDAGAEEGLSEEADSASLPESDGADGASDVPISAFYADALDADANPFDANTLAPGADVNASDGTDPAADAFDAAAIAPEASHDESNRLAPEAAATVSDPGMALASPEDWAIEYDDALLSVAFADDDYAVSPLHGFDVARVVVTAGNTAFELTLVNWTEPGDPEILAGVFSVPVSGADYAISVKVPEEARLPASARFEARAMEDDVYGSAALNAVTAAKGERRTLLALFDLTIYDGERVIQPEAPLTLGVELGDAVPGDARLTIVHFPGSGAQDGTEAIQADPPRLSLKKTQAVKRDEPASELIEAENIDGAAVFTADRFSVFAVVQTILEKVVLASDGHNYRVTVRFGPEAGVPEGAALEVEEIVQQAEAVDGATAYEACVAEALAALGMDAGAFDYARLRLRALFRHQHHL